MSPWPRWFFLSFSTRLPGMLPQAVHIPHRTKFLIELGVPEQEMILGMESQNWVPQGSS
jgi:hypothetical protein